MRARPSRVTRPVAAVTLVAAAALVVGLVVSARPDRIDGSAAVDSLVAASREDPPAPPATPAPPPTPPSLDVDGSIRVDQFGYLPSMDKVAVVAGAAPGSRIELRSASGAVVRSGRAQAWNGGAVDPQNGQRAWWFDFSDVRATGWYEVVDVARGASSGWFVISSAAYDDVLDAALKTFWFNRGNVAHSASLAGPWAQQATLVGPNQDGEARAIDDPDNPSTTKDLRGGWYDAGDTNKYVTFASAPVHQLLGAYERHPSVFDDAVGIPESGNGIPDVLDEVRVELEWIRKMQRGDGAVHIKMGFAGFDGSGPITSDTRPRFYEEVCSSSTIAASAMFAHGARVYADIDASFAADLQSRAIDAWDWYQASPKRTDCDPQVINAGDADVSIDDQASTAVIAAVHLLDLTGDDRYHSAIRADLTRMEPFIDRSIGRYEPHHALALLTYVGLPGRDPNVVATIRSLVAEIADPNNPRDRHGFDPSASAYRSFMPDAQYHWGSNMPMANTGVANVAWIELASALGVDTSRAGEFRRRADAHANTIHGVNPLGVVYLSNMSAYGAENSLNELYHYWYADGSEFDDAATSTGPAPGYVAGGPNKNYSGSLTPPAGQPPALSYADTNSTAGGEPIWEISEPAIYYQSAYVALLASVIDR
ncbi:MAG: glycoside hydrolase family 9 protein [Actinomycetota bacterium]